jgi:hypothetical protein
LGEFVKSWAAGEGKAFVSKPQGGGAQPASGTGPKPPQGTLSGNRDERKAALKQRFPDLE